MQYASFWNGFWFIATVIIAFVAIPFNIDCDSKKEWIVGKILLFLFVIMTIIMIFGMHNLYNSPIIWTKIANERLVSLNDNNMVNGRIYARRGYVNEDLWYQYMVDVGGGGYVANKVPSNGTTIYFDNENPRCEWYEVSQSWWIFKQWETRWKLYVPEGTIWEHYDIDLQ